MIDVRETNELMLAGKITGTKNLPMDVIETGKLNRLDEHSFEMLYGFRKPKKSDSIVVLGKSTKGAARALEFLSNSGYTRVKIYHGGFEDWKKSGGKLREWKVKGKKKSIYFQLKEIRKYKIILDTID